VFVTGHFIEAKNVVLRQAKVLKGLAARAQGEVTIREAIEELKLWTEQQQFELTIHETDTKKLSLIKGWKNLIAAVGFDTNKTTTKN